LRLYATTQHRCFNGWTGADCSLKTCPLGSAWADAADTIIGMSMLPTGTYVVIYNQE